jgi:hypothetical protein
MEEAKERRAYVWVTRDRKTVRLILVLLITRLEALVHKSRVMEEVSRSRMEHLELGYFAVHQHSPKQLSAPEGKSKHTLMFLESE